MSNPLIDELYDMGAIPSIEITLPTMAAFYPRGEVLKPDADPASIQVGPLSLLEESDINEPMMMVSGRAITRLIKHVVPMVDNPQQLCELDIQAILIACRMASYGNDMDLEHTCPHCEYQNSMKINLNEHILGFNPFTPDQLNQFIMETSVGQKINLKPISYEDMINLTMSSIKTNMNAEEFEKVEEKDLLTTEYIEKYKEQFVNAIKSNVEALASTIYYVTTKSGKVVKERGLIETWLTTLPTTDVKEIIERVKQINEDIQDRSKLEYECQQCHKTSTLFVELDPQKLFMQAEDSEVKKSSSAKSKTTRKTTKKSSKASGRLS